MPGLPVHHQLPEPIQTHIHHVSDAIQPSHPLSSPSLPPGPPAFNQRPWQSIPVFLPREFHGQRSLEGYSPWAHKESGTTELTNYLFSPEKWGALRQGALPQGAPKPMEVTHPRVGPSDGGVPGGTPQVRGWPLTPCAPEVPSFSHPLLCLPFGGRNQVPPSGLPPPRSTCPGPALRVARW